MWRSSGFGLSLGLFRRSLLSPAPLKYANQQPLGCGLGLKWLDNGSWCNRPAVGSPAVLLCTSNGMDSDKSSSGGGKADSMSFAEAKKLMRLVNVEALKRKLGMEEEEVIGYSDLLKACEGMGVARSSDEAAAFAKVLDEAGVILLFRDKVYLHPDKVVDLVRRAVPLALAPEDDPRREELARLQKEKEEIDVLAHRQVRRILWSGLAFLVTQVGLFIRLTFWEFSWDVMEPIAFFGTTTGLVISYAYFLFTSSDPTYQDLMKRLYLARQRKLFKKQKFDYVRFAELQKHCKSPLETFSSGRVRAKSEMEHNEMLRSELPPGY